MNERIKELAAQACDIMPLYDSINRGDYTHSQYNMQIELLLEKFAELVVKECIDIVVEYSEDGAHCQRQMIKERFGVE